LTQQVLRLLDAGYKDDAAARQLGMSVRTYRRHVAEIMRSLGATSRFQAGARAAELGLRPPRVS
ncbi:MAG: response regulator transcription factor, partial [Dehalococcoidia bacterium]